MRVWSALYLSGQDSDRLNPSLAQKRQGSKGRNLGGSFDFSGGLSYNKS